MPETKTHRVNQKPRISGRYLADYMAASETAQRTIVRGCKYPPIAKVVQHDDAKLVVGRFMRGEGLGPAYLLEEAESLRNRIADTEFERGVFDHNADYLDRFASVCGTVELPAADISEPGKAVAIEIEGVLVVPDLSWRMQRTTKSNKVKVGAGTLRYAKGSPILEEIALWQSAFLHGYLSLTHEAAYAEPEHKLCLTLCAHAGRLFAAPTNSVARFKQMRSACATIAERWPNIAPPPKAIL